MKRGFLAVAVTVLALGISGCASERMLKAEAPPTAATPRADQATMVFFRTSSFGGAIQSSVFDISQNGEPELIGIVSVGTKVAYSVPPGQRRFMVIGESADFLDAIVAGGKIYYARVSPHFGFWKARFSLDPVPATDPDLPDELEDTYWVENTASSHDWARDNMPSIVSKKAEYLSQWEKESDRETLQPGDGA